MTTILNQMKEYPILFLFEGGEIVRCSRAQVRGAKYNKEQGFSPS